MCITIDFDGVVGVGSSLLHGLMGEAFTLIGISETKRLIKVTNMLKGDLQYLKQYAQDMESIINKAPTKA